MKRGAVFKFFLYETEIKFQTNCSKFCTGTTGWTNCKLQFFNEPCLGIVRNAIPILNTYQHTFVHIDILK